MDTDWADAIIEQMNHLPQNATIEVWVHPGHSDNEQEILRIAELRDVVDFAEKIRRDGKHQVITWKVV